MPVAVGLVFDVPGVMGLLAGGLTSGFAVAIFMANAGGAWDNAKKLIETYGKLTARERIECLVDPGTFSELGSSVNTTGWRIDGRTSEAPCDGAVTGTAKNNGRNVAVYASDFTVLGGSIGTQHGLAVAYEAEDGG